MDSVITNTSSDNDLLEKFGAEYYFPGQKTIAKAKSDSLYTFTAYIGEHVINVEAGDSVYYIEDGTAHLRIGPAQISSSTIATVVRGYRAPERTAQIGRMTTLPFINGCSTRQIFAPERIGDPTLQLLYMPPYSSEQEHHLHSTARVAHVLEGKGTCIIGLDRQSHRQKIVPGTTIVVHPMCPHHFETEGEPLLVAPMHVFSSAPGGMEFNHPMYNGSHMLK